MSSLIYNSKQPDYKYSQEVNLEIIVAYLFYQWGHLFLVLKDYLLYTFFFSLN